MKSPRPRITVRRLMIAVAIAGAVLGLVARRERSRRISDHHLAQALRIARSGTSNLVRLEWHSAMFVRYSDAARHPWMPLGADPPEPAP